MKRYSSNHTPFAKFITHALPKRSMPGTIMEINAGKTPNMDVRFLSVALHFDYMFERPFGNLTIDRRWAAAFTQTCIEIDKALGGSTHGFSWRMLDAEGGEPHWYWTLAKEYDQQVRCFFDGENTRVEIVHPWSDPVGELRSTIWGIVDRGMRRGLNWQDAANGFGSDVPGGL